MLMFRLTLAKKDMHTLYQHTESVAGILTMSDHQFMTERLVPYTKCHVMGSQTLNFNTLFPTRQGVARCM